MTDRSLPSNQKLMELLQRAHMAQASGPQGEHTLKAREYLTKAIQLLESPVETTERCIHGRVVCEPCAQMAVRTHEKVKEIWDRHDRISKLLWGPGSIPGTVLGPMDSEAAHYDRGALLSMLTPAQKGTEETCAHPEILTDHEGTCRKCGFRTTPTGMLPAQNGLEDGGDK